MVRHPKHIKWIDHFFYVIEWGEKRNSNAEIGSEFVLYLRNKVYKERNEDEG